MRVNAKAIAFTAAAALALAASAAAQVMQVMDKKSLTLDGARQVIVAAKAEAKKLNAPGGVIAVVDDGGNLMALERLDGTFAAGANVSIGKARTAVQFKRPTRFFEELINSSGKGRTVMAALNDFTPLIGGVPIMVDNQVVGGVGVSGAASAQQDEELAIAGANSLGNPHGMSMLPVTYIPGQDVSAAFAKGAVLIGDEPGRNYMVHASRRESPGQAEVHNLDTDIIYVLDGAASAQQDEELAIAGANSLGNPHGMAMLPVTYIPGKDVSAAFAKGAVLIGDEPGRNYMVHASRRETPGQAEVHNLDTDIIYVLDGTATFVTGGTVVDGKETAPNELRGASIRDGQTYKLAKGDVVIVPANTPHWFVETTKPFLYYVVKVR